MYYLNFLSELDNYVADQLSVCLLASSLKIIKFSALPLQIRNGKVQIFCSLLRNKLLCQLFRALIKEDKSIISILEPPFDMAFFFLIYGVFFVFTGSCLL